MLIMRYGRAIAAMALVALLTPALPACEQYEYMPTMEPERDEDTFRIGILDPIYDLRPNGYPPLHFVSLVFDPINSFQFSNPNVQFEKPNISLVKMEVSDDGRECLTSLRKGMLFHNGAEVTSVDLKHTIDSMRVENSSLYQPGISVQIIDRYNLRLKASDWVDWNVLMKESISNAEHESKVTNNEDYFPIGSGPYMFVRHDKQKHIIYLKRWDKYWAGPAKYKFVEIHYFSSADAQTMALLEGKIDYAHNISHEDISIIKKNKELHIQAITTNIVGRLIFNARHPLLANQKIRFALSSLIDRNDIVKNSNGLRGAGVATDTLLNSIAPYTTPKVTDKYEVYKSLSLLEEAGCKRKQGKFLCNGKPLTLEILVEAENTINSLGTVRMIAQAWNEAGIPTSIKSKSVKSSFKLAINHNYDVYFMNISDPNSLGAALNLLYHCKGLFWCSYDLSIAEELNIFIKLSDAHSEMEKMLEAKIALQDSIRKAALVAPIYYAQQFTAIRGQNNFNKAYLIDPITLSYQARPGLVR